jgi:hypothetical protein
MACVVRDLPFVSSSCSVSVIEGAVRIVCAVAQVRLKLGLGFFFLLVRVVRREQWILSFTGRFRGVGG